MNSIIQHERRCFICGSEREPLDVHHCIHGSRRKLSDKYGLTIYLCHDKCHINGVHRNAQMDLSIKQMAQGRAMMEYGWSEDEFRQIFGKSYL